MPRVLSVGQCGYDHGMIARHLARGFGVEVVAADTLAEAVAAVRSEWFDLVLVNRVSDADGSSGVDLIRTLKADPALADMPVMLVSNYSAAQEQAESLGALPGFGKSEITTAKAQERLRSVFSSRPAEGPKD